MLKNWRYRLVELFQVAMSKNCTQLWREAHLEVKMHKTRQRTLRCLPILLHLVWSPLLKDKEKHANGTHYRTFFWKNAHMPMRLVQVAARDSTLAARWSPGRNLSSLLNLALQSAHFSSRHLSGHIYKLLAEAVNNKVRSSLQNTLHWKLASGASRDDGVHRLPHNSATHAMPIGLKRRCESGCVTCSKWPVQDLWWDMFVSLRTPETRYFRRFNTLMMVLPCEAWSERQTRSDASVLIFTICCWGCFASGTAVKMTRDSSVSFSERKTLGAWDSAWSNRSVKASTMLASTVTSQKLPVPRTKQLRCIHQSQNQTGHPSCQTFSGAGTETNFSCNSSFSFKAFCAYSAFAQSLKAFHCCAPLFVERLCSRMNTWKLLPAFWTGVARAAGMVPGKHKPKTLSTRVEHSCSHHHHLMPGLAKAAKWHTWTHTIFWQNFETHLVNAQACVALTYGEFAVLTACFHRPAPREAK